MTDHSPTALPQLQKIRKDVEVNPKDALHDLLEYCTENPIGSKYIRNLVLLKMKYADSLADPNDEQDKEFSTSLRKVLDEIDNTSVAKSSEVDKSNTEPKKSKSAESLTNQCALSIKNICYEYKKSGFKISDISLDVNLGEITGVVGANANGKTTLFKVLIGELRGQSGTITFPLFGENNPDRLNWRKIKNQIAYVPQTLKPWDGSLEDNLRFAAAVKGIRGVDNDHSFEFVVNRLGLKEFLARNWYELSGGFRLRFELARALIWRPRLLILDEPLANLDYVAQKIILQDLRALAESSKDPIGIILSTQHIHEVEAVTDHILFLELGSVDYNGPVEYIGIDRKTNVFELGSKAKVRDIRAALAGRGLLNIQHNQLHYTIETKRSLESQKFVSLLIERGVQFDYFRDISRSIKYLFEEIF